MFFFLTPHNPFPSLPSPCDMPCLALPVECPSPYMGQPVLYLCPAADANASCEFASREFLDAHIHQRVFACARRKEAPTNRNQIEEEKIQANVPITLNQTCWCRQTCFDPPLLFLSWGPSVSFVGQTVLPEETENECPRLPSPSLARDPSSTSPFCFLSATGQLKKRGKDDYRSSSSSCGMSGSLNPTPRATNPLSVCQPVFLYSPPPDNVPHVRRSQSMLDPTTCR